MRKPNPSPEQVKEQVITQGQAYVRLIEAADLLLARNPAWTERLLLRFTRFLYTHRLRGLVKVLPPEVTAEILAVSEKIGGPVQGFSQN